VLIKVRRNHLTTTWHLGCPYPMNRHKLNFITGELVVESSNVSEVGLYTVDGKSM
jgi:hypothetical protein